MEYCQIGVFLSYASEKGHVLVDRELYLPKDWTTDPVKRKEASVPEGVAFHTKPMLARHMLKHTLEAGMPYQWMTADSVYGGNRRLRLWLEEQGQWFVLDIAKDEPL